MKVQIKPSLLVEGDNAYVEVTDTSSYAERYDMIACCNGESMLPSMIFTPQDRRVRHTQGITKEMLTDYIHQLLAQQLEAIDLYPLFLILGKASIYAPDLLNELNDA